MSDFCGECFDDFRLDDIGGYSPPCECGYKCRDCCDAKCHLENEAEYLDDDDFDAFDTRLDNAGDPDESDPQMPGWMP